MLPFHKRRANSIIEIGTEELEAIELPQVRPPSVRPGAFAPRASSAPMFPRTHYNSYDAEEMTVVRMDKRASTSPPPRFQLESPRIPYSAPPRFDRDDEPTQAYPSSRPLLSMHSANPRSVIVDQGYRHEVPPPPPPSSRVLPDAPRSAAAVDASASSSHLRAVDLSMTASLSGSTDISRLRRPTMGWATALVAVGVFAGIITAFVARGEGLATAAAFIDPSHQVTADIAKASSNVGAAQPQQVQTQAPVMMPGAAAVQVASPKASNVGAPSCDANAVPAPKVEAKVEVAKVEAKVETKPVVRYVAPVVHHVEHVEAPVVAHADPVPAITKPVVKPAAHHASSNDMDSANAADALAKAQLEAALSR
jgi:hypothetical protein